MQRTKTAFICSRKTPDGLEYLVGKWLLGLKPEADCVMCGNQSPMERAVFTTLLQRKIPVILALAEAMPSRFDADIENALLEERLLVITHCEPSVHNVTARSAFDRNILMLSLAQKIVVGYCSKGGNLERALAGFDNVEYLENGQPWLKQSADGQKDVADGVGHNAKQNPVKVDWSRSIRLFRGMIFLDFMTNGAEKIFKITYSRSLGDGKYSRDNVLNSTSDSGWANAIVAAYDNQTKGYSYSTEVSEKLQNSASATVSLDIAKPADTATDEEKTAVEQTVRTALATLSIISGDTAEGGAAEKMQNSFYPKRSGDITINLMPGWIELREGVVSTSGSLYEYDTHVPLMWLGGGVGTNQIDRTVSMSDVAPTLAQIMQIPVPNAATGTVLEEVVR